MARTNATKPARPLKRPRNNVHIDLGGNDPLTPPGCTYIDRPIYPIIVTPEGEVIDGHRRHEGVMPVNPDAEIPI